MQRDRGVTLLGMRARRCGGPRRRASGRARRRGPRRRGGRGDGQGQRARARAQVERPSARGRAGESRGRPAPTRTAVRSPGAARRRRGRPRGRSPHRGRSGQVLQGNDSRAAPTTRYRSARGDRSRRSGRSTPGPIGINASTHALGAEHMGGQVLRVGHRRTDARLGQPRGGFDDQRPQPETFGHRVSPLMPITRQRCGRRDPPCRARRAAGRDHRRGPRRDCAI